MGPGVQGSCLPKGTVSSKSLSGVFRFLCTSYDPFLPTLNLSVLFELCSYLHALFAHPDFAAVFVNCLFVSPAGMVKINQSVNELGQMVRS